MKGVRHGKRYDRVYMCWCDMMTRCTNPNADKYRFYGGRGIQICSRWLKFEHFYEDMGDPPENMTLDRINPDGNYEKSNCRWADQRTQTINRRGQVMYQYEGESLTLPEICQRTGINYRTMRNRLFRTGMTLEEALSHNLGDITANGLRKIRESVTRSNIARATGAQGVKL